jgi:hypothetical protein
MREPLPGDPSVFKIEYGAADSEVRQVLVGRENQEVQWVSGVHPP